MGNMGGMLMMVNRDYTQVVVVVMPWNKAGFGEDGGKAVYTLSGQTVQSVFFYGMILWLTDSVNPGQTPFDI